MTVVAKSAAFYNTVMSANHHMLVVEDDPVKQYNVGGLPAQGGPWKFSEAANGDDMRRLFARGDVDVVLLDINLPGEDGLSLLRELRRQSEVGVIMVTAPHDSVDRIVALELGADDYVTKPYNMRELLPRAKNLARRVAAARLLSPDEPRKTFGGWTLNIPHWTLTSPTGEELRLTRAEFGDLLATLVVNRGRVCTRDSLIDHVSRRGHDPLDRTIDVLIGRLRRKIEDDPAKPAHHHRTRRRLYVRRLTLADPGERPPQRSETIAARGGEFDRRHAHVQQLAQRARFKRVGKLRQAGEADVHRRAFQPMCDRCEGAAVTRQR